MAEKRVNGVEELVAACGQEPAWVGAEAPSAPRDILSWKEEVHNEAEEWRRGSGNDKEDDDNVACTGVVEALDE
jgi:hypothetical protein